MENDHSDSGSRQILGDWDSILPPVKDTRVSDKDIAGASTSTARKGRVLPPWADPSYQWGGGKWKEDGRKKKKKKDSDLSRKKKKESDLSREKKKESELIREKKKKKKKESSSLEEEDLMNEYYSLPPQIAEWYWCIEYVAKFHKDLPCLLDLMNMGYPSTNDFGSRINDVLSLRLLEFLFDPIKTHASTLGPRIEFDFSLSTTHVLNTVLEHIPLSELRPGIPELSKFNLLPFIAHKNMSLPLCALEMLRDMCARENTSTSAAPPVEPNDPVYSDARPEQRDVCEEMEQQSHTDVLEQTSINDKDKVVDIDDADDGVQTTEVVVIDDDDDDDDGMQTTEVVVIDDDDDVMQTNEVAVIDGNDTSADDKGGETSSPSLDVGVICTKDGAWIIEDESDDDDDELKSPAASSQKNANVPPPRQENVCWKCEREGGASLLICGRSECAAKVHKECLNCAVQYDEDGNFHCPVCWYDRVNKEYHEAKKLKSCAKRRLEKFLPLLSRASKRLR